MNAGRSTGIRAALFAAALVAISTSCGATAVPVGHTERTAVRIDNCGEVTAKLHSRPWHARDLAPVAWVKAGATGEEQGSVHYASKTEATFVAEDGKVLMLWQTSDSNFQCRGLAANGAQGN
jgi:hypothetical protein